MIAIPIPNVDMTSNLCIRLQEVLNYFERVSSFTHGDIVMDKAMDTDTISIYSQPNPKLYRVLAYISHDKHSNIHNTVYHTTLHLEFKAISDDEYLWRVQIHATDVGVDNDDSIKHTNNGLNIVHGIYYQTLYRFKKVGTYFK